MFLSIDTEKIVEKELDKLGDSGEKAGFLVGKVFRFIEKNILAIGVIAFFGILVFIYSFAKGFLRKK
jgi:hypothetical protein